MSTDRRRLSIVIFGIDSEGIEGMSKQIFVSIKRYGKRPKFSKKERAQYSNRDMLDLQLEAAMEGLETHLRTYLAKKDPALHLNP